MNTIIKIAIPICSCFFCTTIILPAIWALCYFGIYGYFLEHETMKFQIDQGASLAGAVLVSILLNIATLVPLIASLFFSTLFIIASKFFPIRISLYIVAGIYIIVFSLYFAIFIADHMVSGLSGVFASVCSFLIWKETLTAIFKQ